MEPNVILEDIIKLHEAMLCIPRRFSQQFKRGMHTGAGCRPLPCALHFGMTLVGIGPFGEQRFILGFM